VFKRPAGYFAGKLIDSGLDKILVSIDAVSAKVYEKIRVGGNLTVLTAILGSPYLPEDGSATHVRHTLCCFLRHHTYERLADRDGVHDVKGTYEEFAASQV